MDPTVRREDLQAFTELRDAVKRNCECPVPDTQNPSPPKCSVCRMLMDQKALDHLMFARTLTLQLEAEEKEQ